ncbi:MAG: DUF1080 domain-containing protein [Acidobacteria bacterium]|nr:DUF1080 domain-containing protein [Acidobacteriota bacterium]
MKYLICTLLSVGLLLAANPTSGQGVELFNGKNLDGFYTFLTSKGTDQDPDRVFSVHDGMMHVSGTEYGYFATKQEYENYHLTVEFKWGEATHPPREGKARDSGVLYHFVGPDKVWPKSIEFQMIEGGTGDIILVDGAALTRGGESKVKGRFDRYEKGPWKDAAGYRDPVREVEKPRGEWNTLELIADGDKVKYLVNGILVNEGTGASPAKGKLLFQSEGAEVFFRSIRIRPLK